MLCKKCKRKIDEHLCPYCGHNNGDTRSTTTYKGSEYQSPDYDVYESTIKSELNDEHTAKVNQQYEQQTTNYNNFDNHDNDYYDDEDSGSEFVQKETTKTFDNGLFSMQYKKFSTNATAGNTVVGTRPKKTNRPENDFNSQYSPKQVDAMKSTYTQRISYNGRSTTSSLDPDLFKIILLAIFYLIFGLGSIPVIGLIMLVAFKKACKSYLSKNENGSHVSLVKVLNVLATIFLVFGIIMHFFIFALIIFEIASSL